MEFILRKASDWNFEETITINSLEDLKELNEKEGHALIINWGKIHL